MIVEFIGTPGAGKSTLLPVVRTCLRERGAEAYEPVEAARAFARRTVAGQVVSHLAPRAWRSPLLWQLYYHLSSLYGCGFLAQRAGLTWHVLDSQRSRPRAAQGRARRVLYWFFRNAGSYEFLRVHRRPDEALLFDEGFVHRVVQLYASAAQDPDRAQIAAYIDLLPEPDLVIHVRAPKEVCLRRIYARGLWELYRGRDLAYVSQFVENAWRVVEMTVAHLKKRGWSLIEVDNGRDDLVAVESDLRSKLACVLKLARKTPDLQVA